MALLGDELEEKSSDKLRISSKSLLTKDAPASPEDCVGQSPKSVPVTPLKPVKDLSQEARVVLACFREDHALYYDDFAMRLDMAPQYLLAALTELSLASYIDLTDDQRYVCAVDLEKEWLV